MDFLPLFGFWNTLCYFLLAAFLTYTEGEPILAWTQKTHQWTRIRGIYGHPQDWVSSGRRQYVASEAFTDRTWHAISYDPAGRNLYWSDRVDRTIYMQPVNDSLIKRNPYYKGVYSSQSDAVTGLAVDWLTGSVYFTDALNKWVAVTGTNPSNNRGVYRVIHSQDISNPTGIAIQPEWAKIFWSEAGGYEKRIEESSTTGLGRRKLAFGNDVGNPVSLTIDHAESILYWVSDDSGRISIKKMSVNENNARPSNIIIVEQAASFPGIAAFQNFIFLTNPGFLQIDVYEKETGSRRHQYVIDAEANGITIVDEPKKKKVPTATLR